MTTGGISMEKKMTFQVSGKSNGVQAILKSGKHTIIIDEPPAMGGQDKGPDPLTTFLGALAGCENVVANLVAKELAMDLQGIEFDIKGILDPRGFMGNPDVIPYFEKVIIDVKVKTNDSLERIHELQRVTDSRCPIYNTIKAAGIEIVSNWTKV